MNTGKTKVMYFSSKYLNSTAKPYKKLTMGESTLDYVDEYKYLGLTVDSGLSFKTHLLGTLKSVSYRITQLKRVRPSISKKVATQLYKSMILPIMDYVDIFIHNKSTALLHKYQTLQNRAIRIISRLSRLTNTDEEAQKLGLISMAKRRSLQIIQFAFDAIKNENGLLTRGEEINKVSRAQTRSLNPLRTQLKIFWPRCSRIEKSLSYVIRKEWNSLPLEAHVIEDKNVLANYLLANHKLLEF